MYFIDNKYGIEFSVKQPPLPTGLIPSFLLVQTQCRGDKYPFSPNTQLSINLLKYVSLTTWTVISALSILHCYCEPGGSGVSIHCHCFDSSITLRWPVILEFNTATGRRCIKLHWDKLFTHNIFVMGSEYSKIEIYTSNSIKKSFKYNAVINKYFQGSRTIDISFRSRNMSNITFLSPSSQLHSFQMNSINHRSIN